MGSRSTHSTLIDDATTSGRSMLTAADDAAQRTLLSVYSSSQVDAAFQPKDGDLTALAALSGTNTIYYRSAANTWSAVTIGSGLTFSGGSLATSGGSGIGGSTGATDNRLLRSDGTGGATLQNSAITVDDSGNVSGVGTISSGAITASGAIVTSSYIDCASIRCDGNQVFDTSGLLLDIGSAGGMTSCKLLQNASASIKVILGSSSTTFSPALHVPAATNSIAFKSSDGTVDTPISAGAITASGDITHNSNNAHFASNTFSVRNGQYVELWNGGRLCWSTTSGSQGTPGLSVGLSDSSTLGIYTTQSGSTLANLTAGAITASGSVVIGASATGSTRISEGNSYDSNGLKFVRADNSSSYKAIEAGQIGARTGFYGYDGAYFAQITSSQANFYTLPLTAGAITASGAISSTAGSGAFNIIAATGTGYNVFRVGSGQAQYFDADNNFFRTAGFATIASITSAGLSVTGAITASGMVSASTAGFVTNGNGSTTGLCMLSSGTVGFIYNRDGDELRIGTSNLLRATFSASGLVMNTGSISGVNTITAGGLVSGNSFGAASSGSLYVTSRFILESGTDGKCKISNWARSAGICLDLTASGTLNLRNLADNAAGNLSAGAITASKSVLQSTELTYTPTGTTQTLVLNDGNAVTLNLQSTTGNVTATLTIPSGPMTFDLLIVQHLTTARDITWAASSGSVVWVGTEPTWNADGLGSVRWIRGRFNGTNTYLTDLGVT